MGALWALLALASVGALAVGSEGQAPKPARARPAFSPGPDREDIDGVVGRGSIRRRSSDYWCEWEGEPFFTTGLPGRDTQYRRYGAMVSPAVTDVIADTELAMLWLETMALPRNRDHEVKRTVVKQRTGTLVVRPTPPSKAGIFNCKHAPTGLRPLADAACAVTPRNRATAPLKVVTYKATTGLGVCWWQYGPLAAGRNFDKVHERGLGFVLRWHGDTT